jgi:hypothetical protein
MKKLANISPAADGSISKRKARRWLGRRIERGIFLIIICSSAAIFFFSAFAESFAEPTPLGPPHERWVHFEIILRLPLDVARSLGFSIRQARVVSLLVVMIVVFWFRFQVRRKKTESIFISPVASASPPFEPPARHDDEKPAAASAGGGEEE